MINEIKDLKIDEINEKPQNIRKSAKNSPLLIKSNLTSPDSKDAKILEIFKHSAKKTAKNIKVMFIDEGKIDIETIGEIMQKSVDLGKDEFIHLTETNREGEISINRHILKNILLIN